MHILIGGYERKVVLEGDIRKVELEPSFEFVNRVDNCVEADRLVQLLERGGDYTDVGVFRSGREHAAKDVFAAFCQTPLNSRNGRGGFCKLAGKFGLKLVGSGQYLGHHSCRLNTRQFLVQALKWKIQLFVIDSQLV